MSTELALIENALSIGQVLDQRKLVMSLMKEAMTEGVHYGKIPGCGDKPSLMQPGAQLMSCTFRLAPTYVIKESDPLPGHREYQVTCAMRHGGQLIAEGVGLCSSLESKYRYRNEATTEDTGDIVPRSYWDNPDKSDAKKRLSVDYDGRQVATKKVNGEWHVMIVTGTGEAKENANPADQFNTVLKMAKKRAYVDATISATACNDLFTQDLEDIRENLAATEVTSEVVSSHAKESPKPELTPPKEDKTNPPASNGNTWTHVTIKDIREQKGVSKKGPWTAHFIDFADGRCVGTFSETLGAKAKASIGFFLDVTVKAGNKPDSWELVSLEQEAEDQLPM